MNSLRSLVRLVFVVAAFLLAVTILLGVRQYSESVHYSTLIEGNERLLFRFATLRESVTEALIADDYTRLAAVIPDLEQLNAELTQIQNSPRVPAEFKLVLADRLDIAGIVIRMRQPGENGQGRAEIQQELRRIADQLLKYDRIIVGQARSSMLDLQLLIIGFMGIAITTMSFSLILLYHKAIKPVLIIADRLREGEAGAIVCPPGTSREIVSFSEMVRQLCLKVSEVKGNDVDPLQQRQLAEVVNETTNQLNGIINYAQLLADSSSMARGSEEEHLLHKIMEAGNDMARSWATFSTGGNYGGKGSGQ